MKKQVKKGLDDTRAQNLTGAPARRNRKLHKSRRSYKKISLGLRRAVPLEKQKPASQIRFEQYGLALEK